MKQRCLLLVVLLLTGQAGLLFAQPNLHRLYQDVHNKAIDYTFNDQYLLSGYTYPSDINGWDNTVGGRSLRRIQLQLLDNTLNTQWFKTYVADDEIQYLESGECSTLSTEFYLNYAQQISTGEYILCGEVRRDGETGGCGNTMYHHPFLMLVNADGTPVWYKRYDLRGDFTSVVETRDGGFMVCGHEAPFGAQTNALVLKTDGSGVVQWSQTYNPPAYWDPSSALNSSYEQIIRFGEDYALVGWGNHSLLMYMVMVTIIDVNGGIIQNEVYDATDQSITLYPRSLCVTDNNTLAICGTGGSLCAVNAKLMIMDIDPSSMNVNFLRSYSPNLNDPNYYGQGENIKCVNGELVVTGFDVDPGGDYGLLVRTDLNGSVLRYAYFDPGTYARGEFVTINTALGVPVISGNTAGNGLETFVLKDEYQMDCYASDLGADELDLPYTRLTPFDGYPDIVHIDDIAYDFELPYNEYTICEPSPKRGDLHLPDDRRDGVVLYPSRTADAIVLHSGMAQQLTYDITDISGRTLLSGTVSDGATVDVSSLSSGLYIVRVRTADGSTSVLKFAKE